MTALEILVNSGFDVKIRKNEYLGKYQVDFPGWYVKDGPVLEGAWGGGQTIEEAARDYLDKIKNKTLVSGICESRQEIKFVVVEG